MAGIDDLKAKLLSSKSSEFTGGFKPVVTWLKGTLKNIDVDEQEGQFGAFVVVKFNFIDIDVLAADPPYDFPVFTVEVRGSERGGQNAWGILSRSIARVNQNYAANDLVGKEQEWQFGGSHDFWRGQERGVEKGEAWEVIAVSGEGSASTSTDPLEAALALLNGKNKQQFMMEALKPGSVVQQKFQNEIITGEFFAGLKRDGKVTEAEDGVFTVA